MSDFRVLRGNIFTSSAQTLVNAVNCVGVMGAGIALEFRLRYPQMYGAYVELCDQGKMQIGRPWLYRACDRWILNFPTKKHWKDPSKTEYLLLGLKRFLETYRQDGIESIAFPMLGAAHGRLNPDVSLELMRSALAASTIPVEIYDHDPVAPDDLFKEFKSVMQATPRDKLVAQTGLRADYVERVLCALEDSSFTQLSGLAGVEGIGLKTLERLFCFAQTDVPRPGPEGQLSLEL